MCLYLCLYLFLHPCFFMLCQGWLKEKEMNSWMRRYFRLKDGTLSAYANPQDTTPLSQVLSCSTSSNIY